MERLLAVNGAPARPHVPIASLVWDPITVVPGLGANFKMLQSLLVVVIEHRDITVGLTQFLWGGRRHSVEPLKFFFIITKLTGYFS